MVQNYLGQEQLVELINETGQIQFFKSLKKGKNEWLAESRLD
jgi:hypothetical protein